MAHVNNARRAFGVAAALVCVVAISACGNDNDSSSEQTSAAAPPSPADTSGEGGGRIESAGETASPASETTAASADSTPPSADPAQPVGLDDTGALLAIEATVGVEAEDVGVAASAVVRLVGSHGGQIYGSDIDLSSGDTAGGRITAKLPPAELEATIEDLKQVGDVVSRTQNTEDVTDQVADLDRRVLAAQASVDRVRALVAETDDLNQLVFLESELTTRQTILEQLTAQRDNQLDRAAMSTLTIELRQRPAEAATPVVIEEKPNEPKEPLTIGGAFDKGWNGFVTAVTAVLVFIGLTAPFLAVALAALLVGRLVMRRSATRPPRSRSRSAAPPPPPAQAEDPQTSAPGSEAAARIP
jgi:Domain of unknown function (DUF4349)